MNGKVLRVVTAHRPPFVFFNGNRTSFQFSGMLVDLLPTLLGYAQISPQVKYYNAADNEGGVLLGNGDWTGEVYAHAVDCILPTHLHNSVLDASVQFLLDFLTAYVSVSERSAALCRP